MAPGLICEEQDGAKERERAPLKSGGSAARRALVYRKHLLIHMFHFLFRANLLQYSLGESMAFGNLPVSPSLPSVAHSDQLERI